MDVNRFSNKIFVVLPLIANPEHPVESPKSAKVS